MKAYLSVLQYGDTADHATATVWTSVATVEKIKPNKSVAKAIDTTHLTSADEYEENIAGLASGGEVEATLQFAAALALTLYGFFRATKAWRIKYPDNSGHKFNAWMMEYGDEEVVNGEIVKNTFKLKVTGKPVPDDNVLS